MKGCSKVKRDGESCPLNNNCRYPDCVMEENYPIQDDIWPPAKLNQEDAPMWEYKIPYNEI
jgi:hypothetical protein